MREMRTVDVLNNLTLMQNKKNSQFERVFARICCEIGPYSVFFLHKERGKKNF